MFATDLDDTLYREIDFVMSGYRAIGLELDKNNIMAADDAINILKSAEDTWHGIDNLVAKIWLSHHDTKFSTEWILNLYRTHKPDINFGEGVRDTLKTIADTGQKIGIITDGRSSTQRAKIEALGLLDFVTPENIIISEEAGGDKTTPIPFEKLKSNNPDEKHFLYIGDNPAKDFRWPNAMGWTTVELKDVEGKNIHSQAIYVPENFKAQYVITNFSDVLKLVAKA